MARSLIGKMLNQGRPIPFPAKWNSSGGLYGTGTQDRFTMMNAMGTEGTLYAIIQLLSTGANATGVWNLYRKNRDARVRYAKSDRGSDQRTEVVQHQALKLWNRPNPFMTGSAFREIGWQHMELAGEWYWVMNRGSSGKSIPTEMWPVSPARMEPVPDRDEFLKGWVYTGPNGETVPLSTDEVIQLRYPHPTDYYRGLSAIQAIMSDIDAAKYSSEWSRNFFLNSAQPGGIVTFSKRLTDPEFEEFTDRWREQHQGVARGHRVGVLEQGATWTPNTYSMRDMQFAELRKVTSEMIRVGYRIHETMVGQSRDVNRANAQTGQEIHIAWHEVPRLDREKDVLNTHFLEIFGDQDKVEFDYEDPYPDNRELDNSELVAKSNAAKTLVDAGFDPHDALEVVGLPDMNVIEKATPAPALPPGWVAEPPATGVPGVPAIQPAPAKPGQPASQPGPKEPKTPVPAAAWDGPDLQGIAEMVRTAFDGAKHNGHREHANV